jgi:signal transduction histidine kinase
VNKFKELLQWLYKRIANWANPILERKWFDVGLRTKMGVLVLVGLIGLMTVFATLGISTARQTTSQVLADRLMIARMGALTLDSVFRHSHSDLEVLASNETLRDPNSSEPNCQEVLRQVAFMTEAILLLEDPGADTRNPICSSYQTAAALDLSDYQWLSLPGVKKAFDGGAFNIDVVPIEINKAPGGVQPWALISVPVYGLDGQPIHVLAALVDLSNPDFFALASPVNIGAGGTMDVVTSEGLVLISTDPDRVLTTTDPAGELKNLFTSGQARAATCLGCDVSQADARDEVIAFAPLSEAEWGVLVRQSAAVTFSPVRRLMLQTLILGALSIVGALGLVWVTTNSVIKPVQNLTEAAQRITEGDLTTPVAYPQENKSRRRDEIGSLAKSFDKMRQRLKESIDEIRAWNLELDTRVQERTAEARAAELEAQNARDDLRAIIDALSDKLVVIDVNTDEILQINTAALEDCLKPHDILGQPCCEFFHNGHKCQPPECVCPRPEVLATGESVKVTHVHSDPCNGEERYVDIVASPMHDSSGQITRIVELARDVTEERAIRSSLEKRNQQLATLNAVASVVNQSLHLEDILGQALAEVLRLTGIDVGAIFLEEDPLSGLKLRAYRGLSEEAAQIAARLGLLDSACGGVMQKGSVIVVPDVQAYSGKRAESLYKENICTLVHVPLIAKGSTLGSMCIGTHERRQFGGEEQDLLTAIGSQIAVAVENARLYAEVQKKELIRGELFKKAVNAQEDERRRIARELHDDTSQALAAMLYTCEELLEIDSVSEIQGRLAGMNELAQRTLDSVHKLIFDLRPTMLDHLGLVPALRWFAESRLKSKGVRVTVEETSARRRLPAEMETALFRVVQEAITNIARHAAARNVCVLFHYSEKETTVTVEDDGIGFEPDSLSISPDQGRGLGLLGMEERLELLGGELQIDSTPGYGTQIHIRVPLENRSMVYA